MNAVSTSAFPNASLAASLPRNSRLVDGPTTWYSLSALRSERSAAARSEPHTMSLDKSGS